MVKKLKFEHNFQISWFCQNSHFQGPSWSKILNLSMTFNLTQISWFHQISHFKGQRVVQNLKFEHNFQRNLNFWILPKFTFCRTGVVKNLKFEHICWCDSDFLILQKFTFSRTGVVQNLKFEQNCQISWFWQNERFQGSSWSKIWNLSMTFNATKISWFHKISHFKGQRVVNKNLKFEHNFQRN